MQLTNPALTADPDHICVCAAEPAQHGWRLSEPQERLKTARRLLNSESERLCVDQICCKSAAGSDVFR